MGRLLLLLGSLAVALATPALAQTGDNCSAATPLTVSADCSGNLRVYTTEDNARSTVASACSPNNTSPDAWFSFVATKPGISVRASVEDFADGLSGIRLELYRGDCGRLESIGCGRNPSTIATVSYAASDFVVGQRYFVRVYGNPDATGEFTICVRGFDPPAFQASDCVRGAVLCGSPQRVTVRSLNGAGGQLDEIEANSCFQGTETNSVWYRFTAANNGNLLFTLTPDRADGDLDFIIYDLGDGDANLTSCNPGGRAVVRCAASGGSSLFSDCRGATGLAFGETDESEGLGCENGNNGLLRPLRLTAGRSYALVVNEFDALGQGFTLDWAGSTAIFTTPDPNFTVRQTGSDCTSGTYEFTAAQGNFEYAWDFGPDATPRNSTERSPAVRFTQGGARVVRLEVRSLNCSDLSTRTINIETGGGFTISEETVTPALCAGSNTGQVKFRTSSLNAYTYTLGGVTNNTGVFTNLLPGPYTVSVLVTGQPAACAKTFSGSIPVLAEPPALDFSVERLSDVCASPTYVFVAARFGPVHNWTFGPNATPATSSADSVVVTFGSAGPAEVTLTEIDGVCTFTYSRSLEVTSGSGFAITELSTAPASCSNPTAGAVSFGVSPTGDYTFTLGSVSNTTGAFSGLAAGSYTVTVVPAGQPASCGKTFSGTIPDNSNLPEPSFAAVRTGGNCTEATYSFTANPAGLAYAWDFGPDAAPRNPTGRTVEVTFGRGGASPVTLTITSGNCSRAAAGTVDVALSTDLEIEVNPSAVSCTDPLSGGFTASVAPVGSYVFTLAGPISATDTSGTFSGLPAGTYQLSVTTPGGPASCASTREVVIAPAGDLAPPRVTSRPADATCGRERFVFEVADPREDATYAWDFGPGAVPGSATGPAPDTVTFVGEAGARTVTVSAALGSCTGSAEATVDYAPRVEIGITPVVTLVNCESETSGAILVTPAPAGIYTYSIDGGADQSLNLFGGLRAGAYLVRVRPVGSDASCGASETVVVGNDATVAPYFTDVSTEGSSCFGVSDGRITVGVPAGVTLSFNGGTPGPESSFDSLAAGRYSFRYTTPEGCSRDTLIDLPADPGPTLDLGPDRRVRFGDTVLILPQFSEGRGIIDSFRYGGLDSTPTLVATLGGLRFVPDRSVQVVTLTLVDEAGCSVTDEVVVEVRVSEVFQAPNAFSPNADDINDKFVLRAGPQVRSIQRLSIYDRWGGLLFNQNNFPPNDSDYGWDGTSEGKELDTGVYVYVARVEFVNGVERTFGGELNLFR